MDQDTEQKTAGVAAAEWWAEQIGAPLFKVVPEGNHADREFGDTTAFLAGILAAKHPVKAGQGEAFVAALAPVVDEQLTPHDFGTYLGVDYGPDMTLGNAAAAAKIHPGRFPYKTSMWVKRDHITASLGYHGATRLIWSAPDWQRPTCDQYGHDREGYPLPTNEICSKPRYHEDGHGDYVPSPARCKTCDGTYPDHYGKGVERRCHSWEVAR